MASRRATTLLPLPTLARNLRPAPFPTSRMPPWWQQPARWLSTTRARPSAAAAKAPSPSPPAQEPTSQTATDPTAPSKTKIPHPRMSSKPPSPGQLLSHRESNPQYQITFTCVPCGNRSTHKLSKQGYHKGSVLITCPSCRNRHVISDHLGIFGDRKVTVEDLMREKGQLVKRGTLGEDGDVEFWPDDYETPPADETAAAASAAAAEVRTGRETSNDAPNQDGVGRPAAGTNTGARQEK